MDDKVVEAKPPLINNKFACNLCDAMSGSHPDLFQRIAEHKYSAIGQH